MHRARFWDCRESGVDGPVPHERMAPRPGGRVSRARQVGRQFAGRRLAPWRGRGVAVEPAAGDGRAGDAGGIGRAASLRPKVAGRPSPVGK